MKFAIKFLLFQIACVPIVVYFKGFEVIKQPFIHAVWILIILAVFRLLWIIVKNKYLK